MNKIYSLLLIVFQVGLFHSLNAQSIRNTSNVFAERSTVNKTSIKKSRLEFNKPLERAATLKYFAQRESADFWNTTTQDWDSTNYVIYTYNSAGLPLIKTFYDVVSGPLFRELSTYTPDNKIAEIQNEEYINNTWRSFMKINLSYAANGLIESETIQLWDSTSNAWMNDSRQKYEYNSNNDVELYTREQFMNSNWTMVFGVQIDRTYENNKPTKELAIYYNGASNTWDSTARNTLIYASNGYLSEFISEMYSADKLAWEYASKENYFFNSNNIIDTAINFSYNIDSSTWDTLQRIVDIEFYNFDGDINSSEFKKFTMQEYTGISFINIYRIDVQKPDNYGSTIETTEEYVNNAWTPFDRFTRNYDDKYSYYELKYEEYVNGVYEVSDHIRRDITYDSNDVIVQFVVNELDFFTRVLTPYQRIRYSNFIAINTGKNDLDQSKQVLVYPNPSTSKATISIPLEKSSNIQIDVLNAQGKLVQRIETAELGIGEHQFQISLSTKGLYFIKVKQDNELKIAKLVIE